jgi:hypothetical protein
MRTVALRAGLASDAQLSRWLQCYVEDVPALLREPAPNLDDRPAIAQLAARYGADAGRLLWLLAAAERGRSA